MATYVPGLQNQDWSSAGGNTGGLGQVALMYGLDKAGLMDFSNPATRKSISDNGLLGHFGLNQANKLFAKPENSVAPPTTNNQPIVPTQINPAPAPAQSVEPPAKNLSNANDAMQDGKNFAGLGSSASGFDPDLLDAGIEGFSDMLSGNSLLALFA